MDARLQARLERLEQQIDRLRVAERTFLELDSNKRALAAQLFLRSEGKSVAEREAIVYASQDWANFINAHVESESLFNHVRRRYELQLKAFDSEYITYKIEESAISRQRIG